MALRRDAPQAVYRLDFRSHERLDTRQEPDLYHPMNCVQLLRHFMVLFWLLSWLPGCTSDGQARLEQSKNFGLRSDGQVWVRGPWEAIHPSRNIDEVIDQLCPIIITLPRAQLKEYGQEYCGLIYSLGEGVYYASAPSPLGSPTLRTESKVKSCFPPRYVEDERGRTSKDKLQANQRWLIRIQFDTACHVQKLIPNADNERPGELYERRGKSWALIGYIQPEDKASGFVTPVEENQ